MGDGSDGRERRGESARLEHERDVVLAAALRSKRGDDAKDNFSVMTGGRNECFIGFFGHDVYTPWRAAGTGALDEDLKASFITIPSAPVLGTIQSHYGIPARYESGFDAETFYGGVS